MAEGLDDFVAGWVSGAAGILVTQPIDFVLTRQQAGMGRAGAGGFASMWRGAVPLLATCPLNNALLFYGYGAGVRAAAAENGTGSSLAPVFAGGCAGGFVQSFLQSPVELVKVRLQLAEAGKASTGALAGYAATNMGKGLSATLLRDVLPHGVWFASYEWCKGQLEASASARAPSPSASLSGDPASAAPGPARLSAVAQLSAGAFAATVAWVVGYPGDLLKTRCQMEGGPATVSEAAAAVYAEGGLRAFYRGLGLKLAKAVPASMVGFYAYEESMALMRKMRA